MKSYLIIGVLFILAFAGCQEDPILIEQNPPVITVESPADNAVFTVNDTMHMKINFFDDTKVQAFTVNIKRVDANSIFLHNGIPNDSSAVYDTTFVLATQAGNYEMMLYCQDTKGNFTNKIVPFVVNQ